MENYNPYTTPPVGENHMLQKTKANGFETAALVCGFISIVTCTCIYGAYLFGALGILFALLSRGGQMKMSSKARLGLILGVIGLVVTTVFNIVAFYIALEQFGSIEGILREYCRMSGLDFEEIYGDLFR